MPGTTNRIGLIGRGDVDDAVAHLHVEGPNLVGLHHSEPAPLDHRRAPHSDAGVGGRDDHVRASEQSRVAGEAATRRDPDPRDDARQPRPERKRQDVETRHHRVVGVARPAAAGLGEQHDRQAPAFDDIEQSILLAMPHHPLRPREHCVVVGEHGAVRTLLADQFGVDARDAGDESVGGCAVHEVVDAATPALRRDRETAVLDEAALVAQICEILAGSPASGGVTCMDDVGAAVVLNQAPATECFGEIGADEVMLLLGHPMSLGAPVSCRHLHSAHPRCEGRCSLGRNVKS